MRERNPTKIQLFHNHSEIAAGTRGASLGPDALRVAAWKKESSFYEEHPPIPIPEYNRFLNRPTDTPFAKRIEGIAEVYKVTANAVSACLEKNEFPLLISGDHASAGGSIGGLAQAHPDQRIGVVWIDAHADLHSPYTTPSGNVHGMPLATALGLDNEENGGNKVEAKTTKYWETLKNTGGSAPKVRPEDIFFIGVRDMEEPEAALMRKHSMPNARVDDVREKGAERIAEEALEQLSECDLIYVSFDVDSLDPTLSHGTGTPVENGLTVEEALDMNKRVLKDPRVQCWEMVEINPTLDETGNRMAENAFSILEQVTPCIETP